MSEELKVSTCESKPLAIVALVVSCLALVMVWVESRVRVKDSVTTVKVIRLIKSLDDAEEAALRAERKVEESDKRIAALEQGMQARMQDVLAIAKRLDGVARNHNVLVQGMMQEQAADKASINLIERALVRIHGKPDWVGAVSAAQTEIVEEQKKQAELRKKLQEAKRAKAKPAKKPKPKAKVEAKEEKAKEPEPNKDKPKRPEKEAK